MGNNFHISLIGSFCSRSWKEDQDSYIYIRGCFGLQRNLQTDQKCNTFFLFQGKTYQRVCNIELLSTHGNKPDIYVLELLDCSQLQPMVCKALIFMHLIILKKRTFALLFDLRLSKMSGLSSIILKEFRCENCWFCMVVCALLSVYNYGLHAKMAVTFFQTFFFKDNLLA